MTVVVDSLPNWFSINYEVYIFQMYLMDDKQEENRSLNLQLTYKIPLSELHF